MSRSRRKMPIHGNTTAESDAEGKRLANAAYRQGERVRLAKEGEGYEDMTRQGYGSPWDFPKDGKRYDPTMSARDRRK